MSIETGYRLADNSRQLRRLFDERVRGLGITGPQARLDLAGEMDLRASTVLFEGDFSLPRKQGFNPLDMINLNRALVSLTKIRLEGPVSQPKTTALRTLKDIIKPKNDNDLGKIPTSISE